MVGVLMNEAMKIPSGELPWGGLQRLSLLDYPGRVASILFVKGCNFRCPFCYNPQLVRGEGREIPTQEILDYLKRRKGWIDGVVITGGEPTLYPGLVEFLRELKDEGLEIKLDTNGSRPDLLRELLGEGLVDYVAMDIKAPLREESYSKVAGVPLHPREIRESLDLLLSSRIDYELRTTVVPTLLGEEEILEIAGEIRGAKRYCLQQFRRTPFHLDERFSRVSPYPREFLERIREKISGYFGECLVRG